MERLQKFIANSGYTSRRKAEELILEGKVIVNGEVVTNLGYKVDSNDEVVINGMRIEKENKVYYLLNKPRGYVSSTSDDKGRKVVTDIINTSLRVYPVGRLDYDTTGALILTNDGEFANLMMHPKSKIDKLYIAKIKGILFKNEIEKLRKGIEINGVKTARARIRVKKYDKKTDTSIVEVIIHEGRNHQVKRMFEAVGHEVLKLKREQIAFLTLEGLSSKEYRMLTPKEVKRLYNLAKNGK